MIVVLVACRSRKTFTHREDGAGAISPVGLSTAPRARLVSISVSADGGVRAFSRLGLICMPLDRGHILNDLLISVKLALPPSLLTLLNISRLP